MNVHTFAFALLAVANLLAPSAHAAPATSVKERPALTESRSVPGQRININTADAKALAAGLNGVGPSKAEAIIAWRKKNGPFKNVAQLMEIKGIGPSLLERNKDKLSLR